jgi:RNA polymerase sigma-70 factor (ECF subfamily)
MAFQPKTDNARNQPPAPSELESKEAGSPSPEYWMRLYQQADPAAPAALVALLSPPLLRFFRFNAASREQAEDLLQETWLKIHRMRHSHRPGDRVLPWVYAIAHHVRIDGYRRTRRIAAHETAIDPVPEPASPSDPAGSLHFESLMAALPEAQREVVIMLKATGMTVDEVARATSSTIGAVKLKAHRAYERLRELLESPPRPKRTEDAR